MKLLFTILVLQIITASCSAEDDKKKKKEDPFASIDYYDSAYFELSSASIEYKITNFQFTGYLRQKFALEAVQTSLKTSVICSPISALMPLGKLSFGARGSTHTELLDALGIGSKDKAQDIKRLVKRLKKLKGVTITIASQIFIANNVEIEKRFNKIAKSVFGSVVEFVNFNNKPDAANKINQWVSSKTNGMIRQLVTASDISSAASIILANAVYFAGKWKYRFQNIGSGTFYSPVGNIQVRMMTATEKYNYVNSDGLDSQVIEIPYQSEKVSFVIILPNIRGGLPHVVNTLKLAPDMLNSAMKRMVKQTVIITMPKFKVESKLDLKDLYTKLNVKKIFSPDKSELNEIIKSGSVFVSSAIQKAIIEVNEIGTEAYAASATELHKVSATIHKDPTLFIADHPFLFYIVGKDEQLFAGTFNQ